MTYGPVDSPAMPKVAGPYSPAVRAGELLFVAGQVGLDPATGLVPGDSFEDEARQALVNLRTVVEAAGAGLERVVKSTVFLASEEDFETMNRVYAEFFPAAPPARSPVIVGLPRGFRFGIDAVVYLG